MHFTINPKRHLKEMFTIIFRNPVFIASKETTACKTPSVTAEESLSLLSLQLVFGSCWQISYFSWHQLINFHIPPSVHRAGCTYHSVLRVSSVIVAKKAKLCFQSGLLVCFMFACRITGPSFHNILGKETPRVKEKNQQF